MFVKWFWQTTVYVCFDNEFIVVHLLCVIHVSNSSIIMLVCGDDGFGLLIVMYIMVDKLFGLNTYSVWPWNSWIW